MSLIVCFTWLLLVCHEAEPAVTAFGSLKPLNPSVVREWDNITLKWNYTIDGSIGQAQFLNATDDTSIAAKFGDGDPTLAANYQERFRVDISNTLAQLTIITVQRSDSGRYKFILTSTKVVTISDEVELKVQYKPENVQLETSAVDSKACKGETISLKCSADAVPSVTSYELFENDSVIMNTSGMWHRTLSSGGVFAYKCVAKNFLGSMKSESVTVTVNVPSAIEPIHNKNTTEGSSVTLSCNASGTPHPMVSWIKVDSHVRFTMSDLVFTNINRSEAGEYRCEARNECGNASETTTIEVQYPANITHISGNQTVNESDVVTLECTADGNPTPININWTRVPGNIPVSFPLTITGKQDEGGYRCTADNGIGNPASQVVYIIVENYHPIDTNLRTSLDDKSVFVNASFNITCSAQANPPAKYRFYENQDNFVNDTTGSDVSVIPVSVGERRKQVDYSCTPFNDFGDGPGAVLTLTVLYAPSNTNLITVPKNTTLLRESNISLHCSTDANPDAHIYHFYLNNNLIGNSSSGVLNTTVMADGVYTCVPINKDGTGENASVSITVVDPPSITIHKISDTAKEGDNITLTCIVTGKPQPIITWTKLGSSVVLSKTSSLTIVNVSRPGTPDNMIQYQCTASNGVETPATATVNCTVHYAPSSTNLITVPKNTTLLRESNISLHCSTDANPDAHSYHFFLNDDLIGTSSSGVFNTAVMADGVYTCVPINAVSTGDNDSVSITVVDSPSITIHKISDTVVEGDNITLTCNVTGKPQPVIIWTKPGSSVVLPKTSSLTIVNVSRPGTPDNMIQYQCTASNGVGTPAMATVNYTVHYAPGSTKLITVPKNTTLLRESNISLDCSTDANPDAHIYHFYIKNNLIGNSSSGVFNTTVMADGVYTCVPINTVGTGDNDSVSITVVDPPSITIHKIADTVEEGDNITLTCNASGKPLPTITWTKFGSPVVLSKISSLTLVNVSRPGTPDNMIQYQCTSSNGVETPATDITSVTVHYKPDATILTTVPSNRTLLRNSSMSLNCEANASPEAEYHFYFNGKFIGNSASGVFNVTVEADGVYTCVPINTVGTGDNDTVDVTAVVAPSVEISNETVIVVEGEDLVLTCDASGKPEPNVTWTKLGSPEVLSNTSLLAIVNISRPGTPDNMIQYQCTASNGVGTPATATSTIDVYYGASVSNPRNEAFNVEPEMEVNFLCLGIGNPTPTVNWTSADGVINWMSNLNNVTFKAEAYSSGSYLCTIKNQFGEAFKRFYLVVVTMNPLIKVTVTNRGRDDNFLEICKQIGEMVNGHIKREDGLARDFKTLEVEDCETGSVTAYLSLDFTQNVKIPDVLRVLKNAAEDNGFGDFQVDPGSIQAISEEQLPTDPPSTTAGTTMSEDDKDKEMLWIIIGASVGGAIVLIIVVVVVAWCVHHKRKCRRKGSKVRCSESEAFAPEEGNDHGHANNGYADAGPRPTAMEDKSQHQGASAVPTYAVVDKSAKKASKKDKVEEKKPQAAPPEYAAVDKSKKKKKEEPDATYAEVEKSKKSKKKPKPGEVLYADLGDFHQMQELPAVSTSPQALPPIKKPTPYGETQYADITQFLKGDATLPESNNSQGPGTGTQASAAPENSNSQEPGAGTKKTSQVSNPGGDGGPGHETNF